ncbi:MAG: MnmC family methyltransferase [Planctomycetota bacterium]|nr:MnmC family methyltransferase [Planctomycetota bacterium]
MSARWTERLTADGSSTLAHADHGETFHSMSGAWTQARERYARECRLRERALELAPSGTRALRLLDVGTGLGFNLAAALEALADTGVALEATSLERDRDLLVHARAAPREPADLERWHAPVRLALGSALASHGAESVPLANGRLRLRLGDARASLAGLPEGLLFDAVFLDPFSPRVEPELWSRDFLAAVARRMAPGSRLSTYSAATEVRAGLLAAGLRVGRGARVGEKREGTLASPDLELPSLDPRVLRRLGARVGASGGEPRFGAQAGDPRGSIP